MSAWQVGARGEIFRLLFLFFLEGLRLGTDGHTCVVLELLLQFSYLEQAFFPLDDPLYDFEHLFLGDWPAKGHTVAYRAESIVEVIVVFFTF